MHISRLIGWGVIAAANLGFVILLGVVFMRFAPAEAGYETRLRADLLGAPQSDTACDQMFKRYAPNLRDEIFLHHSPVTLGDIGYPEIRLSTNAGGWRDVDHELEKPADTIRVVLSGDSYAFCTNLDQSDILSVAMQRAFDQTEESRTTSFEVFNFGLPGLNFEGMVGVTRHCALPYDPDVVVYTHICDDLSGTDVSSWHRWSLFWKPKLAFLPPALQEIFLHKLLVGYKELRYKFDDMRYGSQEELARARLQNIVDQLHTLKDSTGHEVLILNYCRRPFIEEVIQASNKAGQRPIHTLIMKDVEMDYTQHATAAATRISADQIVKRVLEILASKDSSGATTK
ncbi:MAG: hypothetical protein CMH54_11170 [Myxococcales bacterium]|nr:hypothetical protein [Myxococcales bacterium]|tara:strand:+ start:155 stop:1183 length:1029 start_codon:yes stop_codon:yes gene_type:complete